MEVVHDSDKLFYEEFRSSVVRADTLEYRNVSFYNTVSIFYVVSFFYHQSNTSGLGSFYFSLISPLVMTVFKKKKP